MNLENTLPTLGVVAQIVICLFVFLAIAIVLITWARSKKKQANMFFHDNYDGMTHAHYAECHRPFIAAMDPCKHDGEKSLITVWVACTCEEMHTFCDDCGEDLGQTTDC